MLVSESAGITCAIAGTAIGRVRAITSKAVSIDSIAFLFISTFLFLYICGFLSARGYGRAVSILLQSYASTPFLPLPVRTCIIKNAFGQAPGAGDPQST